MPEVNIFTHLGGANVWQVSLCWEQCPWHCSSVHKMQAGAKTFYHSSWDFSSMSSPNLWVAPMVQKLDYLLNPVIPCQSSLH